MGVSLRLKNFEKLFFQQSKSNPIIINDFNGSSEKAKESFNKQIYTKYETHKSDLLSNLPSCECGEIVGEFNVGVICQLCHHPVQAPLEQELQPLVWMRAPNGVRALMNPHVWIMLKEKFERSNFEIIRWLCDTSYQPVVKMPADPMNQIQAMGIPRGYNNFVDNFDTIMDALFELKVFKKKGEVDPLQTLLREQRDCIFSQYLPLPNRALLVIEETNVGPYADPTATGAVDAIHTMVSIDSPLSTHSLRVKENRTVKTISLLAQYYEDMYRTFLGGKEGLPRKHIFGIRCNFSFRAVISSLTDKHDYDELYIPWGVAVSLFRIHLVNKLFRRGYTPNEAVAFLNEHAQKYHPLLDELFNILIAECPYKGIPVVFQRNPSLERASAQAMFVTKVKTDTQIPTVSLSILSVTGYNADFDGDQLNGTLSIDNMTAEELRKLAPHMSTFDLNEPRRVSKNLSMPKPVVATIANWVHHVDKAEIDPVKLQRMASIPEA